MNTDSMLIDQLRNAVRETVREFQEHHADFLSENDIQSLLFVELRHELSNRRYDVGHVEHRFSQIHAISPVKTEYQINSKGLGPRVDIAVLSEVQNSGSNLWRQPCRIAIEIKLWQPGGPWTGPWEDVNKLKLYWQEARITGVPFTGIVMLFVHPIADKWRGDMPDIGQWPEETIGTGTGPDFPSDGIALHLITKSHWKQLSIPSTSVASGVD